MSLKVKYGLKIDTTNFKKINKILNDLTHDITKEVTNECFKLFNHYLLYILDEYHINKHLYKEKFNLDFFNQKYSNLFNLQSYNQDLPKFEIKENMNIKSAMFSYLISVTQFLSYNNLNQKNFDYGLKLHILPHGKNTLILPISSKNNFYYTYILKNTNFKEYYYQNSSDKPKEFSSNEWRVRERKWNNFFKGTFSETNYLSKTIITDDFLYMKFSDYNILDNETLLSIINKQNLIKKERVKSFSLNLLFTELLQEECDKTEKDINKLSNSFIMDYYQLISQKFESDENIKEKMNTLIGEITNIIPDDEFIKSYINTNIDFKDTL